MFPTTTKDNALIGDYLEDEDYFKDPNRHKPVIHRNINNIMRSTSSTDIVKKSQSNAVSIVKKHKWLAKLCGNTTNKIQPNDSNLDTSSSHTINPLNRC